MFISRFIRSRETDHEALANELNILLENLKITLPEKFENVPLDQWHSSEYQVVAIQQWAKDRGLTKEKSLSSFLQYYCAHNKSWRGAFVLLARLLLKAGKYSDASEAATTAQSLDQLDLDAQQVERDILAAMDSKKKLQFAETEEFLKSHFCTVPFEKLETSIGGNAFLCCPAWLPISVGNIERQSAEDIWLGAAAEEIRESIIDGSFRYCSRKHCSWITNRALPKADDEAVKDLVSRYREVGAEKAIPSPKHLTLSHDESCNLACPSCRKDFFMANKQRQGELDKIADEVLHPLLRTAGTVCITGSGDPFGSNHFRRLIKSINRDDFPNLTIDLHSNGQLFDRRGWEDLGLDGLVGYVQISIDAARKETYEVVRRGGSFERLLQNLEFIAELRRNGEIKTLDFSMVVQTKNFEEMPDFVRLGNRFGVDRVQFHMIRNWGTFGIDEYQKELIGSRSHPRYPEFVEILRDSIFDDGIVRLGEMRSLH